MKIDTLLHELPDEEAEALRAALSSDRVCNTDIAQVLTRHGHRVSEAAVRRWRTACL